MDYVNINKFSPVPLHEQIKSSVIKAMRAGIISPGEKLPTENEICQKFGVSRPVVRQAYSRLAQDGLVERKRGIGTFVKPLSVGEFITHIFSYKEELNILGKKPGTVLVASDIMGFDEDIFSKLHLEKKDKCLKIERMRYANDQPFTFIKNYVPIKIFPGLEKYDFSKESLYHILTTQYDAEPVKSYRTLYAGIINIKEAGYLQVSVNSPINMLESLTFDKYDRPIDYSIETYPGNYHRFSFIAYKE
jgi:GntR family transcriptional regulator